MRTTSWNWSIVSEERRPRAVVSTRPHFCAAAMRIAVLPLLLALGVGAGARLSPPPSGASTLVEPPGPAPAWGERLGRLDEAIQMRRVSRAAHEWRHAYGEALRSRSWEALLATGDRAARIDGLLPRSGPFREEARRAYLAALLRARSERSDAGVLGAADAFQRLGDAAPASAARRMLDGRTGVW